MILPSLRFSIRYLKKQSFFTTLHIAGLTLGISVAVTIFLFIKYELSFDSWSAKAGRTYRINSTWSESGRQFDLYATPLPLADVLRTEVQGLEHVAMVLPQFRSTVAISPDRVFSQENIIIAEPDFVDIFDIEVLQGDRQALRRPYQALLSRSTAQKFFGNEDPVGRSFRYRSQFDIKVSGVFRDLPGNSSLRASILMSYTDDKNFTSNGGTWYFGGAEWTTLKAITFAVLEPGADPSLVQSRLDKVAEQHINKSRPNREITAALVMQSLSDIHLDATRFGGGPWVKAMDFKWIIVFAGIGLAVLFLACVNFVNLSTAQAIVRTKEAGIRKVAGARRHQLIFQFLVEPLILILISSALAVFVSSFSIDRINQLFDREIEFSAIATPSSIVTILLALVLTAIAAGLYPAWLIACVNPATSLKPGTQVGGFASITWLRKTLVVFQFCISAVLITTVFTIGRQVDFIRAQDLGFRRDSIATIELPDKTRMKSFAERVRMIPGVKEVSLSRSAPISNDHWWNTMGTIGETEEESVCVIYGDELFYKVYGLKLISGRIPVSSVVGNEIHQVVVNEKLLHALSLGSPEEAIGKRFSWAGTAEVVGVVANFNNEPLHYEIAPALIFQDDEVYKQASIRFDGELNQSVLLAIESLWKNEFPSEPFEAKILNDEIGNFYKTESTMYNLFFVFAGVAVVISCMGLLGLSVFATVRRRKEISIRKVLGASIENILLLLSGQFMKVIGVACLIALPASWLGIDFLLGFYAFRIDLTWELLLLPMILLMVIAFITLLTQTVRASLSNPVESLKSE